MYISYRSWQVNFFVGAFYDAVWLYGLALSEALHQGASVDSGHTITRRMWARNFTGNSLITFTKDN